MRLIFAGAGAVAGTLADRAARPAVSEVRRPEDIKFIIKVSQA